MTLLRGLLDLVLPPSCQVCRNSREFPLCRRCCEGFRLIGPPLCQKCGTPLHGPADLIFTCVPCRHRRLHFFAARAAGVFDSTLREAIHALKFRARRTLAAPLGALMADCAAADARLQSAQIVVPVPLHRSRLRERGFNQSELLAREVAERMGFPLTADLLIRGQVTQAQSGLSLEDRRRNVRGAFVASGQINGSTVLLVDDVISTGSTASECARALRKVGAAHVVVLTAAIAILE